MANPLEQISIAGHLFILSSFYCCFEPANDMINTSEINKYDIAWI